MGLFSFFKKKKKNEIEKAEAVSVKEAPKASNSNLSAYKSTVRFELRSKSKHLAKQDILHIIYQKTNRFLPPSPEAEGFLRLCENFVF